MTLEQWSDLLFWAAAINMGLLMFAGIFIMLMPSFVYRLQGQLFKLPEERIAQSLYLLIGFYKILIIVFFVAPWIATQIIS